MSDDYRFPLPEKFGPSLGSTVLQIKTPKSLTLSSSQFERLSEKLFDLSNVESNPVEFPSKKKSKQQLLQEQRHKSAIFPEKSSKKQSFWDQFKVPLDSIFSETYVSAGVPTLGVPESSSGIGVVQELDETSFVKKTKALLLNEEVLKEVEASAPGDKIQTIVPKLGRKALKKQKKAEREKTKGSDWFNMPAPEMTPELQNELDILRMRGAIDPTRFYKKADSAAPPKYFQIGHVIDSPVDYYSNRVTKKDRKKTLVDELMADAEFKKFSKRKYVEIIAEKAKTQKRGYRPMDKGSKHKAKKAKQS